MVRRLRRLSSASNTFQIIKKGRSLSGLFYDYHLKARLAVHHHAEDVIHRTAVAIRVEHFTN